MIILSINYTGEEDIPSLTVNFYLTEYEYVQLSESDRNKIKPIIKKIGDKYVFLVYKINTSNNYIREVIADIIDSLYNNKPVATYKDYSFKIRFIETGIEYVYSYTVENEKVINEELSFKHLDVDKEGNLVVNPDAVFEYVSIDNLKLNKEENIKHFIFDRMSEDDGFDGNSDYNDEFYNQLYNVENLSSLSKEVSSSFMIDFPSLFSIDDYDSFTQQELKIYFPKDNTISSKEQFRLNRIESTFVIHERNMEMFGDESYVSILENILQSVGINLSLEFRVYEKPDLYILSHGKDSIQESIYNTRNIELLNTVTIAGLAIFHAMHEDLLPVPLFLDVNKMSNVLILSLRTIFANNNVQLLNTMQTGNNKIDNQLILINENDDYLKDIDDSIFDRVETYIPQYTMNEEFDKNVLVPF